MLEFLSSTLDPEVIKNFLSEAAQLEFTKTCAIFGFAAFVHGRQVSKAIRSKFDELVMVLKADLEAQKSVLDKLGSRVNNIESKLHIKRKSPDDVNDDNNNRGE